MNVSEECAFLIRMLRMQQTSFCKEPLSSVVSLTGSMKAVPEELFNKALHVVKAIAPRCGVPLIEKCTCHYHRVVVQRKH
jgi:hypothetical protein